MRRFNVTVDGVNKSVAENLLTFDKEGRVYTQYNSDMSLDIIKETEIATKKLIKNGEEVVESHIQEPITAYNKAKGVKFSDAHNCETWSRDNTYEHQAFCLAAWEFHKAVFVASRALQISILENGEPYPTAEAFKAMLPDFLTMHPEFA